MADILDAPVRAPLLNPLQRAWLREIGMEKVWLRDAPQPAARGEQAGAMSEARPVDAAEGQGSAVKRVSAEGQSSAGSQVSEEGQGFANRQVSAEGQGPAKAQGSAEGHGSAAGPESSAAEAASGQGAAVRPPLVVPRPAKSSAPSARTGRDAAPAPQPAPTAEALAMLDLTALRERVITCEACGLCRGRRQAVFGMGPEQARWLVVGEAPGEQEDRQGLPFVGRSGQLLDAMLAAVGMNRERDVYIANVIKCRPPGNRNPKPEEIAACRPYLMRQIQLLKPERILVLGRFAAQTLLETDAAIGSLRGRVHALKTEDGEIPMVVSYHPAYLLRSPSEKARAWQDLRLAVSL